MAISIDYTTNEILVPKADTTLLGIDPISGREQRQLDVGNFKISLSDLQDNQGDVWASTAFENTSPNDIGSIVLGRALVILAPYFITFEAGTYSVNLINGNSNIISRTTINGVVPISNNTAGLAQVNTGGGSSVWSESEKNTIVASVASIESKLPTDGNNIASDQQVNDASGTWTVTEKNDLIAAIAALGIEIDTIDINVDSIVIKLPSDGNEISSDQQVASATGVWSVEEKDKIIVDIDTTKRQATKAVNNTEKPF